VIGKNGVGKSTLFDVFGFLSDTLKFGVEKACDLRGGFEKIRSQGETDAIQFLIIYKEDEEKGAIVFYNVYFNTDSLGRPFVEHELLEQISQNDTQRRRFTFLILSDGKGFVWKGKGHKFNGGIDKPDGFNFEKMALAMKASKVKPKGFQDAEWVGLSDSRRLGIATLGTLKKHPLISAFREFMEGWYLSYFTPDAARTLPLTGAQQHLNSRGDNLANVVQFMEREHRDVFQDILNRIAGRIPGIDKIDTEKTSDGRLLLRFNDRGFQDPFYAPQMSDGTLKVFAYLLLLEDPTPPPFICIEEPENGLYHKLLEILAAEFRTHATGEKNSSQLFITTHQPYFVDALDPEEVWILEKGEDGFSTIRRASDDELVKNMVAEGLPLGGLWYSDYLDARSNYAL
jgi:predicted ATPase